MPASVNNTASLALIQRFLLQTLDHFLLDAPRRTTRCLRPHAHLRLERGLLKLEK
jgi:hypothetical protein